TRTGAGAARRDRGDVVLVHLAVAVAVHVVAVGVRREDRRARHAGVDPHAVLAASVPFGSTHAHAAGRGHADDVVVHRAIAVVVHEVAGHIGRRERRSRHAAVHLVPGLAGDDSRAGAGTRAARRRSRNIVL